MTYSQVYLNGKACLQKAGIESPAFEAMCLFEAVFQMNRQLLAVKGEDDAPNGDIVTFNEMIQQRCGKRPLQYILGKWPFLDLMLEMGEGVLIAREDTEVLVRTADEHLRGRHRPQVLDLCAGTGAVGLGLASLMKDVAVTCVEYYDTAFRYLERNVAANGLESQVSLVRADVLAGPAPGAFQMVDGILSNPPYVKTAELETLQAEVQKEPKEALDGGEDGLTFYRAIAGLWLPLLKPGGLVALEVGEGQSRQVGRLLEEAGIQQVRYANDFGGIERVVFGTAPRD
ncbi:MAG: peptide chain release factor N(5)-glutamine methyltransferase [Oscillospiraceae bacterium]|nr:peptide chain release factor N(5)-glutamine methyltransferase [Oscillospiraceae bacterium]